MQTTTAAGANGPPGSCAWLEQQPKTNGPAASAEQHQAQSIYLCVVAVMKQVENAEGESFASGRHDQNDGFNVPQQSKKTTYQPANTRGATCGQ